MQAVTKMAILAKFRQLTWRFLCKLHQQRWAWRVGEFDDFGDFYANYVMANLTITRDGSNMLANLANLRFLCKLHHQRWANVLVNLTISAISITSRVEAEQKDMYFLRSLSVLPKQNTSSTMRVASEGNRKQYTYFPCSLFPSLCKRVANRIPSYKACYQCVTESQMYLPTSKACFSSGTESNVSLETLRYPGSGYGYG